MRTYEVRFLAPALDDLIALYRRIGEAAGAVMASGDLTRIEAACLGLELFPLRGAARDDIRPGLRTMGFERRAVIVFLVEPRQVSVLRVFHGGQDFERIRRALGEAS